MTEKLTPKRTQANRRDSPLLKLPAELRETIYEHVFRGLIYEGDVDGHRAKPYNTTEPLALRQTCRQIRHETREAFYKSTIFHFENINTLYSLLDIVGSEVCGSIRNISASGRLSFELEDHAVRKVHILNCPMLPRLENIHIRFIRRVTSDVDNLRRHICRMFGAQEVQMHFHSKDGDYILTLGCRAPQETLSKFPVLGIDKNC